MVPKRKRKLAAAVILAILEDEDFTIKRRFWVNDFFLNRPQLGFFAEFHGDLKAQNPDLFKNFVRMDAADFDFLLELVTPIIRKEDTKFRKAISPAERLAVTLRYLATGESFCSLRFLFRIADCTLSRIIHETCNAIYAVLKDDFLKVRETIALFFQKFDVETIVRGVISIVHFSSLQLGHQ